MKTVITTQCQRVWLDDEGIVRGVSTAGAEMTRKDAEASIAAVWEISGHQARPLLVDLRRMKSIDREARAHYAGPAPLGVVRAIALLTESTLTRGIANFFMTFNQPSLPTRMFTSEDEALAWLRTFLT